MKKGFKEVCAQFLLLSQGGILELPDNIGWLELLVKSLKYSGIVDFLE